VRVKNERGHTKYGKGTHFYLEPIFGVGGMSPINDEDGEKWKKK